jgi:hypothetical protein
MLSKMSENTEWSLERVEKALQILYDPSSSQQLRSQSQQWLNLFLKTNDAWNVSVVMLQRENFVVRHFGAQTLEYKVKYEWSQLNQTQQAQLLKFLLNYLKIFTGPEPLLTRLCVVVAQITLQTIPSPWTTWLDDLIALASPDDNHKGRLSLLEMLRILPEEVHRMLNTDPRRKAAHHYLNSVAGRVLCVLNAFLQNSEISIQKRAAVALLSWVELDIPLKELVEGPIIETVFHSMRKNIEIVPCCCEVISHIIQSSELPKVPNTVKMLLEKIVGLFPLYEMSLQTQNDTVALSLCGLFGIVGEHFPTLIIREEIGKELLKILLKCTTHPNLKISEATFQFWFEFFEEVMNEMNDSDARDELEHFQEVAQQLVEIIRQQFKYPLTYEQWQEDQIEAFRTYRTEGSDTLLQCYDVLKGKFIKYIFQALHQEVMLTNPKDWRSIEATLFTLHAVNESAARETKFKKYADSLLQYYPHFPSHPQLAITAIKVLGAYAPWMSQSQPNTLIALRYILLALKEKMFSSVAARALNLLLKRGRHHLIYFTSQSEAQNSHFFQQVLGPLTPQTVSSHLKLLFDTAAPLTFSLDRDVAERALIMEALSSVVLQFPTQQRTHVFQKLVQPLLKRIADTLTSLPRNADLREVIRSDLRVFAAIFVPPHGNFAFEDNTSEEKHSDDETLPVYVSVRQETQSNPFRLCVEQIWPLLENIVNMYKTDEVIFETVGKFLIQILLCLDCQQIHSFLPSLLTMLCLSYEAQPHPAALKVFSVLLAVYRQEYSEEKNNSNLSSDANATIKPPSGTIEHDEDTRSKFSQVLKLLITKTIDFIQRDVTSRPDLVKLYFDLLIQVNKTIPKVIYAEPQLLLYVFQFNISMMLCLPTWQSARSEMSFFEVYCSEDRDPYRSLMAQILDQTLPQLITNLLKLLIEQYALSGPIGEVIVTLIHRYPSKFKQIASTLLSIENFPTAAVTTSQKEQFLSDLFKTVGRKTELCMVLSNFAFACRGN